MTGFLTHRKMIISLPESSRARPSNSPKGEDRANPRQFAVKKRW